MGEVVDIGSVVLEGQQDPRLPIRSNGGPKLVALPRRKETPQQQIAGQFVEHLANIENFVILAQTKDGKLIFFPCVDSDPGVALFIDVCKAKMIEDANKRLSPANKPTFA
jgi:hypothetical protein